MVKMSKQDFNNHLMSQIQSGKLNMQDAQKLSKLHGEQAKTVPKKAVPKKKIIAKAQEVREKLSKLDTTDSVKAKAIQKRRDRANKKQEKIKNRVDEARMSVKNGKMSKKEGEFIEIRAHEEIRKTSRTVANINRDERRLRDENAIKQQRKLLHAKEGPAEISTNFGPGFNKTRKNDTQEGIDEFSRMVGKGTALDGMTIGVKDIGDGRSHALRGSINLGKSASKKVVIHEMGHMLEKVSKVIDTEATKNVYTQALSFLDKRTMGEEAQQLRDITGNRNYDPKEVAKPDKFRSPYTGKIYPHGATEIISMGLEQMFDNPAKFAKDDPDYFDFIFNALENARR